ncbi:hypothetical protein MNEG_1098 [Monoraphidium neglectum]|uniref:DNA mismatch repair proteins mutS family domain-containing protein n=1 Tax=Monoraphidium neglectum TaxID=145388 RepID=A0A0D2N384_9CHLO|nr:hypothetical protein MNEG_1098 [Monoraphidium neglectum]KIZ06847.1 hypothetical protein MNEG_1098 [Monoraphidium neglectum]|eukprot:XP_013905866.1 hypothetical protein MNEG_1098 [Monoraphidium neglectum]
MAYSAAGRQDDGDACTAQQAAPRQHGSGHGLVAEAASASNCTGSRGDGGTGGHEAAQGGPPLVFLYQVRPGGAGRSFGLNVARMAGLPPPVVSRASEVARHMQQHDQARGPGGSGGAEGSGARDACGAAAQGAAVWHVLREALSGLRGLVGGSLANDSSGPQRAPGGCDRDEGGGGGVSGGEWVERTQEAARRALLHDP